MIHNSGLEILVSHLRGIREILGVNLSLPSPKVHGYQRMAPIISGITSYSEYIRAGGAQIFFHVAYIKTRTTRVVTYHSRLLSRDCKGI